MVIEDFEYSLRFAVRSYLSVNCGAWVEELSFLNRNVHPCLVLIVRLLFVSSPTLVSSLKEHYDNQ